MLHYIDIHLRPEPELPAHHLMAALYRKLHRVLASSGSTAVGVVFPDYKAAPPGLGEILRLCAPGADLTRLMEYDWLRGLRDHLRVSVMAPVPAEAGWRCLRRVQAKSSPERLRRRHMRRHGLTETQAIARVPDSAAETLRLPFLTVASSSTGQNFRLFLRLDEANDVSPAVSFNAYGLAGAGAIPWF